MKKSQLKKGEIEKLLYDKMTDSERIINSRLFAAYAMRKALIIKLGTLLPSGAKSEIAKLAGVNRMTITRFFKGQTESVQLYEALDKYILSIKELSDKLIKETNS